MKKWTFRQKRDLLNKLEPWIITLVQFISALLGAACGIAICYFF
nr:MAG TPA: YtxH-like protein [Caudoviricetes sp.]